MDTRAIEIASKRNKRIITKACPGHFATSHSHVNYYIDMTSIKCQKKMAKNAAREFAQNYAGTAVDTIICLDGTEIIGAFLADEISQIGINSGTDIAVITPEINSNNQMLFRDNTQRMLWKKRVILLVASVSTGKTLNRALECVRYYGGEAVALCALFSAVDSAQGTKIDHIFAPDDVKDYHIYPLHDCPYCKEKRKIDAIINSYGYSKI